MYVPSAASCARASSSLRRGVDGPAAVGRSGSSCAGSGGGLPPNRRHLAVPQHPFHVAAALSRQQRAVRLQDRRVAPVLATLGGDRGIELLLQACDVGLHRDELVGRGRRVRERRLRGGQRGAQPQLGGVRDMGKYD